MANTDNDIHAGGHSFKVTIDGFAETHYELVSGIGLSIEDIPSHEKKNQILNKPGRFSANDITIVKRLGTNKDLPTWVNDTKQGKLVRKSGSVIVLDSEEKEVRRFNFFDAWPKHYSLSDFSKEAGGNNLMVERVILSVSDLEYA